MRKLFAYIIGVPHKISIVKESKAELGSRVSNSYPEDKWLVLFAVIFSVVAISQILGSFGVKANFEFLVVEKVASSQAMPMGYEKGFILLKEPTPINLEGIPEFDGLILERPQKIMECDGKVLFYVDRPGQIYLINLEDARVKVYTPKVFPGGVRLECYKTTNIVVIFREIKQQYVRLGD